MEATREVSKSDTLAKTYRGTYNLPNHTMDEMEDKELNPETKPDGTRPTARRPTDTAMTNHRNLLADKIAIKCRAPIEDHADIVATSRKRYPSRHEDIDKGQIRPKDCTTWRK